MHDLNSSLRGEVCAHNTCLTPPLFFKCLYQARKVSGHVFVCQRSCICVLVVSILPLSTILIFDFLIDPTVHFYCFSFYLHIENTCLCNLSIRFDFCVCLTSLSAIFQLYHGDQFKQWKKPEYESSAPCLCNLQSRTRTHAVLVIGLYEVLGNPTT